MRYQPIFASFTRLARRLRFSSGVFGMLGAAALLFGATNANAACGMFNTIGSHNSIRLPALSQAELGSASPIARNSSVVGLWHVLYTNSADGSTFNDTFDTWHSDGTEFESAFLPPLGGNVCVGVWRQTGPRSVSLHHVGWMFDPTNPGKTATNSFTLDEIITVSPDGQGYTGSFTFKIWNLDGTYTGAEVTGTIAAIRITAS
jgi:hypothetical protein